MCTRRAGHEHEPSRGGQWVRSARGEVGVGWHVEITMLSLIAIRVGTESMVGFVAWKQRSYSRKVSLDPSAG